MWQGHLETSCLSFSLIVRDEGRDGRPFSLVRFWAQPDSPWRWPLHMSLSFPYVWDPHRSWTNDGGLVPMGDAVERSAQATATPAQDGSSHALVSVRPAGETAPVTPGFLTSLKPLASVRVTSARKAVHLRRRFYKVAVCSEICAVMWSNYGTG